MRNSELVVKRTNQINNKLQQLKFQISRNTPYSEMLKTLTESEELLEDLKSIVERDNTNI